MSTATLHSATPLSHLALFRSFSARLSERQRAALSELAAGRPILAAAAAAGVHRSTLHGWLSHCEDFQAAYAALCRHQSEADSDLAALARASLQALITDPATSAELRLRAIQTALKLVQSRPATPLLPALERPPDAPLPPPPPAPALLESLAAQAPKPEATPVAKATVARNAVPYITLVQDIVQASSMQNCPRRLGCRGERDLWPLTIPEKTRIKLRGKLPQ